MPRLTIIIPVLDQPRAFEAGLVSVLENRPPRCEILAVLNRPYDDPYELGDELTFVEAKPGASVGECVQAGINAASNPLVHILAPGAVVREDWTSAAVEHFQDKKVAAVAPVVIDGQAAPRIISAGLKYAARGTAGRCGAGKPMTSTSRLKREILGATATAAFFRREAIARVGGIDASLGAHLWDVDLALRLVDAGYSAVFEPESIVCGAGCVSQVSSFRRGLESQRLYRLRAATSGKSRMHAVTWLGDVAATFPRPGFLMSWLGRVTGTMSSKRKLLPVEEAVEDEEPHAIPIAKSRAAHSAQSSAKTTASAGKKVLRKAS